MWMQLAQQFSFGGKRNKTQDPGLLTIGHNRIVTLNVRMYDYLCVLSLLMHQLVYFMLLTASPIDFDVVKKNEEKASIVIK